MSRLQSLALLALATCVIAIGFAPGKSALAATPLIVNTPADNANGGDGDCTLREAITNLNANDELSGGDCVTGLGNGGIYFTINAPIVLASALPDLNRDMLIDGGANGVTISGDNKYRIFVLNHPNTVTLIHLTLTNGRAPNGTDNLNSCTGGASGGAIYNTGKLLLYTVRITASRAGDGGSVLNGGGCAGGSGGGIYNFDTGWIDAYSVTFDHNHAGDGGTSGNGDGGDGGSGGALANIGGVSGGLIHLQNATLTENERGFGGSGVPSGLAGTGNEIYQNGNVTTLLFSTVSNNRDLNIQVDKGFISFRSTLLQGGTIPCWKTGGGDFVDEGDNIDSGTSCGMDQPSSLTNTPTGLSPTALQDNGGYLPTIALAPTSIAIDRINNGTGFCGTSVTTDARGAARPHHAKCDLGAYEYYGMPGTTFVVNHGFDNDGPDGFCDTLGTGTGNQDCTLYEAIDAANAIPGHNTITFDIPDTDTDCSAPDVCMILLFSSPSPLNDNVTIDGSAQKITLSGELGNRVFENNADITATIHALTIRYAHCNACSGAGIWNKGNLTVTNSTFRDNAAEGDGGAIFNQGVLTISNSTFTANDAADGGAIFNNNTLTLTNVTIANNSGDVVGGVFSTAPVTINNTLVTNNSGGDCSSPFSNTGANNLSSDATCGATFTQKTPAEINLQGITDNGGNTDTMALQIPSAAIDAGDNTLCANAPVNNQDQRGETRPNDGDANGSLVCDIGAYEAPTVTATQTGPNFIVNHAADTDDGVCDVLGQGLGNQDCTLREAINAANTLNGANTITFDIPDTGAECSSNNVCTITLGGFLPLITDAVTIDGAANGADITLDGAHTHRVLTNASNATYLIALTIINGSGDNCGGFNCGGGILNDLGRTLHISDSTFEGNSAQYGGAIYNDAGTLTVTGSTFTDNNGTSEGGAIFNYSGTLTASNNTFFYNVAYGGGALYMNQYATTTLRNNTMYKNRVGDVGYTILNLGTLIIHNTIVAHTVDYGNDNTVRTNCAFGANSVASSHNLTDDATCGAGFSQTADLNLGALADNGGPTQTIALGSNSAAIDAGDDALCADANTVNSHDQRGEPRDDLHCDVGAFEFVNSDGHTVTKNFDADNSTLTFGPTLAQMQLLTGSPLTLIVNRELTPPGNSPPAGAMPITWDATTQTVEFDVLATLCYDPTGLTPTYENGLHVFHYNGSTWDDLGGTLDTLAHAPYHCVTATTALTSLSPLILASDIGPTADNVTGLKGTVNAKGSIVIRWKTTSENQIAGFNVYRKGKQGEWKMLNANLKQAKHAGTALGDKYRLTDKNVKAGKTYRYKIEIVYLDGHREWTNAIRVPVH